MPETAIIKTKKQAVKQVVVTSTQLDGTHQSGRVRQAPQQRLIHGVTQELAGSEAISGAMAVLPPLMVTKMHLHPDIETILFIIEGIGLTLVGPELKPVIHGPGEFVYIHKNVMHLGANLSAKDRIVVLEIRTDPNFDGVELHPEMEEKAAHVVKDLQQQFAAGTLNLPEHLTKQGFGPYCYEG